MLTYDEIVLFFVKSFHCILVNPLDSLTRVVILFAKFVPFVLWIGNYGRISGKEELTRRLMCNLYGDPDLYLILAGATGTIYYIVNRNALFLGIITATVLLFIVDIATKIKTLIRGAKEEKQRYFHVITTVALPVFVAVITPLTTHTVHPFTRFIHVVHASFIGLYEMVNLILCPMSVCLVHSCFRIHEDRLFQRLLWNAAKQYKLVEKRKGPERTTSLGFAKNREEYSFRLQCFLQLHFKTLVAVAILALIGLLVYLWWLGQFFTNIPGTDYLFYVGRAIVSTCKWTLYLLVCCIGYIGLRHPSDAEVKEVYKQLVLRGQRTTTGLINDQLMIDYKGEDEDGQILTRGSDTFSHIVGMESYFYNFPKRLFQITLILFLFDILLQGWTYFQ